MDPKPLEAGHFSLSFERVGNFVGCLRQLELGFQGDERPTGQSVVIPKLAEPNHGYVELLRLGQWHVPLGLGKREEESLQRSGLQMGLQMGNEWLAFHSGSNQHPLGTRKTRHPHNSANEIGGY